MLEDSIELVVKNQALESNKHQNLGFSIYSTELIQFSHVFNSSQDQCLLTLWGLNKIMLHIYISLLFKDYCYWYH